MSSVADYGYRVSDVHMENMDSVTCAVLILQANKYMRLLILTPELD